MRFTAETAALILAFSGAAVAVPHSSRFPLKPYVSLNGTHAGNSTHGIAAPHLGIPNTHEAFDHEHLGKLDDNSEASSANTSSVKEQMAAQEAVSFKGLDCLNKCSSEHNAKKSDNGAYVACMEACKMGLDGKHKLPKIPSWKNATQDVKEKHSESIIQRRPGSTCADAV